MKLPGFVDRFLDRMDEQNEKDVLRAANWGALPPEEKVRIVEAMGFVAFREPHQPECPVMWDSGLICNCVRPTTTWGPPTDVQVLRRETWEDRLRDTREWKARTRK